MTSHKSCQVESSRCTSKITYRASGVKLVLCGQKAAEIYQQNILLIEHSAEHSAGKGRRDLSAEHSMRLRRPGPWPGAEAVTLLGPGPGAVTECHRFCGRLSRRVRFAVTALGALPVPQRPGDPVSGEARPPPPSMMTGSQGPGPSYRRAVSSDSARNSCQARDWPGGMTAWRD